MSETDSEPKTKADVYRDRNLLALAFIAAHDHLKTEIGAHHLLCGWWTDTDDVNGEEWAVVWADLPSGQVGWHVPMELVPDWLPKRDPEYDGYSTEEKNDRLAEFAGVD
jgi:hypothetical protein